jgi:dihydroorotase
MSLPTPQTLVLPRWYDLHAHFRQGPNVSTYLADHRDMGCAGILAMPNTAPPVTLVTGPGEETSRSIESYLAELKRAGADVFDQVIVPLYLTANTTADMIARGAASGLLRACKYYPPHGTTNSQHGMPLDHWIGHEVLDAMAEHGVMLCLHGEQHGLHGAAYFDQDQTAESIFYENRLPKLVDTHPTLKLVCEHITTESAVRFVEQSPATVAATVTPQHLLYTIGDLIQGLKYHLYCLPIVKFASDRASLQAAVTRPDQTRFFAGTDSAPHAAKVTECGCAAGCYTGGCAPQLYAMAFEAAGIDLASPAGAATLTRFLCLNGPAHYGFPPSEETFRLVREPSQTSIIAVDGGSVTPLPSGLAVTLDWSLA